MIKSVSIKTRDFLPTLKGILNEGKEFQWRSETGATIDKFQTPNGQFLNPLQVYELYKQDPNTRVRFYLAGVVRKHSVGTLKNISIVYNKTQPNKSLKELDKRYKVSQQDVLEMRKLRKQGYSYQKIADIFGVSQYTANYWTNEKEREKQQAKNAKRRRTPEEKKKRAKRVVELRAEKRNANELYRLGCDLTSMKYEHRKDRKRYTSKGKTLAQLQREYDQKKTETSQKVF